MKSGNAQPKRALVGDAAADPAVLTEGMSLVPVPLDCLPVNFPLPCPLYVAVGERFVMIRSRNDTISGKRIQSLAQSGADSVHIIRSHWKVFIQAVEDFRMPTDLEPDERMRHMRALLMAYEEDIEQQEHPPRRGVLEKLEALVGALAAEIFRDSAQGVRHLRRNHDPRLYSANHAVNSAIYATLIGMSLKYPLDEVKRLAYACLVHDVGNLYVPKEVLQKKGPLTPDEFKLMQSHAPRGAELLQSLGAATEVVQTAYQHHERVDGKGYPRGLNGKDIHPFAKICAIADVYDAITSTRPHQEGLSGQEAMRRMRSQEGLFDMDFLAKLSFDKIR